MGGGRLGGPEESGAGKASKTMLDEEGELSRTKPQEL